VSKNQKVNFRLKPAMSETRNVYSIDFLRAIGRQIQQSPMSTNQAQCSVDEVTRNDRILSATRLSVDTCGTIETKSNLNGNHDWWHEDDSQLQFAFDKE